MPIEVDRSMEDKRRFGIEREHNEEKQKLNIEHANESVKLDIEQAERRLKEALEAVEQKRMTEALKRESNEKNQKWAYRKEENEKRLKESLKKEENEMRQREASEREENGKRGEDTLERHEHEKQLREEEKRLNDDYEGEEAENRCEEIYEKKEETRTRLEETSEQDRSGKSRLSDAREEIKMEIKIAHDVEEIQEACEWQEIEVKLKNAGNEQIDRKPKATGMVKDLYEREKEEDFVELPCSDVRVNMAGESGKDTARSNSEETKSASQADSEVSKRRNGKDNMDDLVARRVLQESVETGRKMNATQPVVLQMQGSTHKTAQQLNTDQNMEKKMKNINETISEKEKENERTRREKELEEERLRKIEEEREREREREKDRMAVDRATLEARDRAYTDARERAERTAIERATAEARQRALNEARERLEKACAEAREKSQADKASAEARLRAERAAVERATAEVRERAFGKAMAERTAFGTRDRMERSISDKFSASSRTTGMRPSSLSSDLQSQSAGLLNGSRHLYSSVYSSSYLERSEGIEGESDQRCKARLERHQRTADRAAKALAEKNMRDLLAQREQAERNRLAETLDAEVKRWSSGKEGNLRALLSTLQYILGPGSGWQPIPLTEVITAAAVKKAYRKATLCVHPDKLQQRGASIQHKYICEKVFDLLKDAWNKFNSEER